MKNAVAIHAGDVVPGDRVLVNLGPGTSDARRMVVMPVAEIAKHDEVDRAAWTAQGIGGVVIAKHTAALTLRQPGRAASQAVVTVSDGTLFRKYAPDSVKFADAQASTLDQVQLGDQVRARGERSADGTNVAASEVVFGSFVTRAGKISAVDAGAKALTIAELNTGKTLRVLIAPGSQVKALPELPAMGGPPDLARMIESLPDAAIESFKPGQTIVVSSTRGSKEGELTAIVLLGHAEMLIRMASMSAAGGQSAPSGMTGGAPGGAPGLAGGFELPSMTP